jgi:hypothetical protein
MARNDDTAATCLLLLINTVLDAKAGLLDGIVENGCVFVVSYTAEVDDGVRGQNVLCSTSSVLCSSTSNEFCIVVVQEVFVERGMLLLSENGIVGLETILVKQSLITVSLDI